MPGRQFGWDARVMGLLSAGRFWQYDSAVPQGSENGSGHDFSAQICVGFGRSGDAGWVATGGDTASEDYARQTRREAHGEAGA